MFEATRYTPENEAIDWRDLADKIFPVEVLGTAAAFNPLGVPSGRRKKKSEP
jgi:hypothetical protein